MTAGASKAAPTTIQQPALAPSPQPRPAPTGRALPPNLAAQGGQNWTPIRGQIWAPIDTPGPEGHRARSQRASRSPGISARPSQNMKSPRPSLTWGLAVTEERYRLGYDV